MCFPPQDPTPSPVAGRFNCTTPIKIQDPDSRIGKLTAKVVKGSCNDTDKAYGIYRWISSTIAYDTERFYDRTYETLTAEQVLDSGKSVCEGFSALYDAMAKQAGLQTKIARGRVKTMDNGEESLPDEANHQWNMVYLEGRWHFVDTTWGAGYSDRSKGFVRNTSDRYFLMDPYLHSITHWDFEDNFGMQRSLGLTYEEFERLGEANHKLLEIGFTPRTVFEVARQNRPKQPVMIYDNASDYIALNDTSGLYYKLPPKDIGLELTLKQKVRLSIYANEEFTLLPEAKSKKQVIQLPKHLKGRIVVMAEDPVKEGEYTGLLAYQR